MMEHVNMCNSASQLEMLHFERMGTSDLNENRIY